MKTHGGFFCVNSRDIKVRGGTKTAVGNPLATPGRGEHTTCIMTGHTRQPSAETSVERDQKQLLSPLATGDLQKLQFLLLHERALGKPWPQTVAAAVCICRVGQTETIYTYQKYRTEDKRECVKLHKLRGACTCGAVIMISCPGIGSFSSPCLHPPNCVLNPFEPQTQRTC